jgi:hypothetical protein
VYRIKKSGHRVDTTCLIPTTRNNRVGVKLHAQLSEHGDVGLHACSSCLAVTVLVALGGPQGIGNCSWAYRQMIAMLDFLSSFLGILCFLLLSRDI